MVEKAPIHVPLFVNVGQEELSIRTSSVTSMRVLSLVKNLARWDKIQIRTCWFSHFLFFKWTLTCIGMSESTSAKKWKLKIFKEMSTLTSNSSAQVYEIRGLEINV